MSILTEKGKRSAYEHPEPQTRDGAAQRVPAAGQPTAVDFDAADLWPPRGAYGRFGSDLDSFAEEVTRRLRSDGCLGFRPDRTSISIIRFDAVKGVDFTVRSDELGCGTRDLA